MDSTHISFEIQISLLNFIRTNIAVQESSFHIAKLEKWVSVRISSEKQSRQVAIEIPFSVVRNTISRGIDAILWRFRYGLVCHLKVKRGGGTLSLSKCRKVVNFNLWLNKASKIICAFFRYRYTCYSFGDNSGRTPEIGWNTILRRKAFWSGLPFSPERDYSFAHRSLRYWISVSCDSMCGQVFHT